MMLVCAKLLLRICSLLLVAFAIATLMRGGFSFTSQPQMISTEEYVVRHSLIFVRFPVGLALLGIVLFALSFLIRGKGSEARMS